MQLMGKRSRRRCLLAKDGELIQKILVRLPVKSLLLFKSVCKSWFTLIESSSFTFSHLHTFTTFNSSSPTNNEFGSFIFLASVDKPRAPDQPYIPIMEHSLVMVSPKSKSNDEQQQQQLVLQLDSLWVLPSYQYVVGSCNGLVCLSLVYLWNPATKKHRILPKPIEISVDRPKHLAAFGFDVETKDYKVVLLTCFPSEHYRPISPVERVCRFQVYNLSTDSWRLVEGITCLPGDPFCYPCEALYLNGSIFFMAHFFRTKHHQPCIPESDRFVFSFDLTKEIITPIQLPDHHRGQDLYLSCLGDKLALFTVVRRREPSLHQEIRGYEDYDIWVLNEHNNNNNNNSNSSSVNKDSWTKLHSFQITVKRPENMNIPRGISNDGKFAFLELNDSTGNRKMKLYHFFSKEVKQTFPSCGSMMFRANAYKPSLVSITGGGNGAAY